jgi:CPA2 family monovalent cation:H+ antiporter-2
VVTGITKYATAYWIGLRPQLSRRSRRRAGAALLARGEFSIVIGGLALAAGAPPQLTALTAGYVLVMATAGPLLARAAR